MRGPIIRLCTMKCNGMQRVRYSGICWGRTGSFLQSAVSIAASFMMQFEIIYCISGTYRTRRISKCVP